MDPHPVDLAGVHKPALWLGFYYNLPCNSLTTSNRFSNATSLAERSCITIHTTTKILPPDTGWCLFPKSDSFSSELILVPLFPWDWRYLHDHLDRKLKRKIWERQQRMTTTLLMREWKIVVDTNSTLVADVHLLEIRNNFSEPHFRQRKRKRATRLNKKKVAHRSTEVRITHLQKVCAWWTNCCRVVSWSKTNIWSKKGPDFGG